MLPATHCRTLLEKMFARDAVHREETAAAFVSMLKGELPEALTTALLVAWRFNGESAQLLRVGAETMRAHALPVAIPADLRPLADNCGTGGDGAGSFNISTASAIVASAAGVRVAKHGNRSVSSQCGSADLLFAAGFPQNLTQDATVALLAQTGFTFFFAPQFHPTLKHVTPVRRALGIRTVFNLLGPLANPIAPEFQVIGVGAHTYLRPMAEALSALGVKRGLVVHSRDGMDELSAAVPTDAVFIDGGTLSDMIIDPEDLGVHAAASDLQGCDPRTNLLILLELLTNDPRRARLIDAIALNAGALIWLADGSPSLATGIAKAHHTISSGQAGSHFELWIKTAKSLAGAPS
jgi:anthranilate phosphoribosyltransferase